MAVPSHEQSTDVEIKLRTGRPHVAQTGPAGRKVVPIGAFNGLVRFMLELPANASYESRRRCSRMSAHVRVCSRMPARVRGRSRVPKQHKSHYKIIIFDFRSEVYVHNSVKQTILKSIFWVSHQIPIAHVRGCSLVFAGAKAVQKPI